MARAPWCSEEIYDAAASFRDRCLREEGSLFTDRHIWTVEALEAVDARVAMPIGDGNWLDKLEAQLEVLSPDEILLGAELVFVLLLPQGDTYAETKRKHLSRVLALLPRAPEVPKRLDAAFDGGGVATFSSAKSWTPALLRFVIHLAVRLKELPAAQRDSALADPWAFRDLVDEVRTSTDQMMANAIKHLLFPDSFESIISPHQREQLLQTFENRPEVAGEPDDDRKISRIVELAGAASDGEFTLYDETFRAVWSSPPDPRWEEGVRLAEALYGRDDFDEMERDYKLAVADLIGGARAALLSDDAGWPAALEAALKDRRQNLVGWRVRDPFLEWVNSDLDRSGAALRLLWSAGESGLREFVESLPDQPPLRGSGTRASVASFLLMGVDVHRYPFYKPTVHEGFRRALGLPRLATAPDIDPETTYRPEELAARLGLDGRGVREFLRTEYPRSEGEHGDAWLLAPDQAEAVVAHFASETDATSADALYVDWVALLRGLRYRLLAGGTDLRDLLDAQGLAWWLVSAYPPEGWSADEIAALEAFARGASSSAPPRPAPPASGLLSPIDAEFAAKLHLPSSWLSGLTEMLEDKKQVILYGPPGTGKTFIAQHLGEYIASHGGGYRLVQFHPSYTYEDFFEGYRPKLHHGGALSFELVPGALREIAAEARDNPAAPYLLIIDEINRGNLAKIFGELYFLLEYRDAGIRLQYSREEQFSLPPNLYVLGTMNTADRSIALVDSALRRRFLFEELSPMRPPVDAVLEKWLAAHDHDPDAAVLLRELNATIDDEDFSIGPSYFITSDGSLPKLERIWANSIMPLLQERYYGTGEDLQRFGLAALRKRLEADED
jgi:5-methylcytosine-specific restriction enzyme B